MISLLQELIEKFSGQNLKELYENLKDAPRPEELHETVRYVDVSPEIRSRVQALLYQAAETANYLKSNIGIYFNLRRVREDIKSYRGLAEQDPRAAVYGFLQKHPAYRIRIRDAYDLSGLDQDLSVVEKSHEGSIKQLRYTLDLLVDKLRGYAPMKTFSESSVKSHKFAVITIVLTSLAIGAFLSFLGTNLPTSSATGFSGLPIGLGPLQILFSIMIFAALIYGFRHLKK